MEEYAHEYADIWLALPREVLTTGGCWIVRAGRNVAKPNYYVGPKVIEQYSIHWILQGNVRVKANGQTVELQQGDLFCIFPGRPYIYETTSGVGELPLKMVWLALEGAQLPWMLQDLKLSVDSFWARGIMDNVVRGTLRNMLRLFQKGGMDPLLEQSLVYELFWKMKNNVVPSRIGSKANWATDVKEYLELHYTENIRIEDVASHFGIHRSHLYVEFHKEFCCSPQQFLQRLRMDRGASLLRETQLSVTEIALSLGYPELYSFTRVFTKYYGLSPKAYRN